jgi:hypothetical protein
MIHDSDSGSSGSLRAVRQWNPDLAGLILVWSDPVDNKTYCINGHNRLWLAHKLAVGHVAVRFISATNERQARLIGALANIAEDRGTAIDAGKVMRETKLSPADLQQYGCNLSGSLASQGLSLANLPMALWEKIITGEIPIAIGVAIGAIGEESHQFKLWELLKKEKRSPTSEVLSELVESLNSSDASSVSCVTLFGLDSFQDCLALEKSALQSYCLRRLKRERKLFALVARSSNAAILESEGNSFSDSNGDRATLADRAIETFNSLKNVSGPICKCLNHWSQIYRENPSERIKSDCYTEILSILSGEIKDLIA